MHKKSKSLKYVKKVWTGVCFFLVTILVWGITFSVPTLTLAQEKRTLSYWSWTYDVHPDLYGSQHREFERKYNVKIELDHMGWIDCIKKTQVAARAGGLPDVIEIWAAGLVPQLAEWGALEGLGPYIEKEGGEKFLDRYIPLLHTKYKGKYYSIPDTGGVYAMFYNKDLLNQAGLPVPKTWMDLAVYGKKLTNPREGKYGLVLDGADLAAGIWHTAFIAQNGGRLRRGNEILVNSPASIGGLQFLLDLINRYKIVASYSSATEYIMIEMFSKGKIAFFYDPGWGVSQLIPLKPKFEYGITTMPKGKYVGTVGAFGDTEFSIPANSKNKDLAWEFIKFLTSPEKMIERTRITRRFPAVKAVLQDPQLMNDPNFVPFVKQLELGNVIDFYGELPYQRDRSGEILTNGFLRAVLGKSTLQEAMDEVAEEWKQLLTEWEEKYGV